MNQMLSNPSTTQNAWSFALRIMNSRHSWTILDVYFGTDDVVIEECYQCERAKTGKSDALPHFRSRELSESPLQLAFTMNTFTPCKYSENRRTKEAEPESQRTYNSTTVYESNFNRKKLPPMESKDTCLPVVPLRRDDSGCRGDMEKGKPMMPKSPDSLGPSVGSRRASEDKTSGCSAGIPERELLDVTMINNSCNKVTIATRRTSIGVGTLRIATTAIGNGNQLLPVVTSKTSITSNQLLPVVTSKKTSITSNLLSPVSTSPTSPTSTTQESNRRSPQQRKRSIMKKRVFLREEYFNVTTDACTRRRMSVSWADGINNNLENIYHVETLHPSPRRRACSLPMLHQLILPVITRRCTHIFS